LTSFKLHHVLGVANTDTAADVARFKDGGGSITTYDQGDAISAKGAAPEVILCLRLNLRPIF
jgi:hypothetical protein